MLGVQVAVRVLLDTILFGEGIYVTNECRRGLWGDSSRDY